MPVCMMHLLRAPPLFITQSEAFQTAPHAPFPPPYQPALAGIRSAAHPSGWLQVQVKQRVDNVAGVKIPKYEYIKEAGDSKMDLTGLAAGGQQVSRCKDAYGKTVELLVKLASLQSARNLNESAPRLCVTVVEPQPWQPWTSSPGRDALCMLLDVGVSRRGRAGVLH